MAIMDRHRGGTLGKRLHYLEHQLDAGGLPVGAVSLLDRNVDPKAVCPHCGEDVIRFKYWEGVTFDVVIVGRKYVWHQCPQPVEPREWDNVE